MSATLEVPQAQLAEYVAVTAVDQVLSIFAWLDDDGEILGDHYDDRNPAAVLDPLIWGDLHDDAGKPRTPEIEHAGFEADQLAARMLRLLLDDPERIRERAMFYERRAAEGLSSYRVGGTS